MGRYLDRVDLIGCSMDISMPSLSLEYIRI